MLVSRTLAFCIVHLRLVEVELDSLLRSFKLKVLLNKCVSVWAQAFVPFQLPTRPPFVF